MFVLLWFGVSVFGVCGIKTWGVQSTYAIRDSVPKCHARAKILEGLIEMSILKRVGVGGISRHSV